MPSQITSESAITPPFPHSDLIERRHCYFTGRVQGVGFRYTTKNIAMRFDVNGYVRNLPDGRVELVIEGPVQQLDDMLHAVKSRMTGYIRDLETHAYPPTAEFGHFHIRH